MKRPATYEDANLLLRLYEMRREETMRKARTWFRDEFKAQTFAEWQALCPLGTVENAYYRQVTTYWEMACSLVAQGVLEPELFIQNSLEHLMVWVKVEAVVGELRRKMNAPQMLRNLETVAELAKQWLDQQGEGVAASFAGRFKL
jgi:hypothetical protein